MKNQQFRKKHSTTNFLFGNFYREFRFFLNLGPPMTAAFLSFDFIFLAPDSRDGAEICLLGVSI